VRAVVVPVDRHRRMGESACQKKRPQRKGGKAEAVPDQLAPRQWAHPTIPRFFFGQWFQGLFLNSSERGSKFALVRYPVAMSDDYAARFRKQAEACREEAAKAVSPIDKGVAPARRGMAQDGALSRCQA
jgi:hypothetical protein